MDPNTLTQIGIFAINAGMAFGIGVLWQKVRGHDQSLEHGRENMILMNKKLDRLIMNLPTSLE